MIRSDVQALSRFATVHQKRAQQLDEEWTSLLPHHLRSDLSDEDIQPDLLVFLLPVP